MSRLIVTADDFGMSLEVNEAVEAAHREGVLTCASLVVAGAAAADAVRRAQRMPRLGVGLHLALYGAPSAAAPGEVPDLLHPDGSGLGDAPERTGARIAVSHRMQAQVRREVRAQFEAFRRSGLSLDHLDGHWHCHQHPTVLTILLAEGSAYGLRAVRTPHETPGAGWRAAGRRGYGRRAFDAAAHLPLVLLMRRRLRRAGVVTNDHFFGKHDGGAIDLAWMLRLLPELPPGVSELGLHPATSRWSGPHAPPSHWRTPDELEALTRPELRDTLARHGVRLLRFADLPRPWP